MSPSLTVPKTVPVSAPENRVRFRLRLDASERHDSMAEMRRWLSQDDRMHRVHGRLSKPALGLGTAIGAPQRNRQTVRKRDLAAD
jgi:hypothetical protein